MVERADVFCALPESRARTSGWKSEMVRFQLNREKGLKQEVFEVWEAVHSCIPGHGQAETRRC